MLKTKAIAFLSIIFILNVSVLAQNNNFYIKTIVGCHKNSDIKTIDPDINFMLSQKSKYSPSLGIGIGYYTTPSTRIDLLFENIDVNFATKSGNFNFIDDNGISYFGTRSIKRKANIQSVMLNGYIDVITEPDYRIFLGTGLGIGSSRIKERKYDRFNGNIIVNGNRISLPPVFSTTTNKNNNIFSCAFILGTDVNISDDFNIELSYSWKHYGKVRVIDRINNKYQGHNLSVAGRFDL